MIRAVAMAGLLLLVACDAPPPRAPTEGEAQQKRMDAATAAYNKCIDDGANSIAVDGEAAGTLANRVVLGCKALRDTLFGDVVAFNQIGHPEYSIAQSKNVAEASIATIEDELRRQTVVTIVRRQTADPVKAE